MRSVTRPLLAIGSRGFESDMLLVSETDNTRRVRDGYISESTCGHARALPTRSERPICRTNVTANDRACTRLSPQNFHGKEGVDGSSPSEGFVNTLHIGTIPFESTCRVGSVR